MAASQKSKLNSQGRAARQGLAFPSLLAPCPATASSPGVTAASHPYPRQPGPKQRSRTQAREQTQAQTQGCGVGAAGPEHGRTFVLMATARRFPRTSVGQSPAPSPLLRQPATAPLRRHRHPDVRDSPRPDPCRHLARLHPRIAHSPGPEPGTRDSPLCINALSGNFF